MLQDLRYALRQLRRTPAFTSVAVLTLALGIGANTAIFSVMNAVLLRYLPVRDPQQLVYLHTTRNPSGSSQTGHGSSSLTQPIFEQLRQRKDVFADVMAYVPLGIGKVAVRYGKEPDEAEVLMVSGNFFSGLGVQTVRGRAFSLADEASHAPVAVLSYAWWTRRFGRDSSVIGQPLYVKDVAFTVVGITSPGFAGVDEDTADLWIPFQDRPELLPWGRAPGRGSLYHSPNWWFLMMMGRLAPGVTGQEALAHATPVFQTAAYANLPKPDSKEELPKLVLVSAKGMAGARETYELPALTLPHYPERPY